MHLIIKSVLRLHLVISTPSSFKCKYEFVICLAGYFRIHYVLLLFDVLGLFKVDLMTYDTASYTTFVYVYE